MDVLTIPTVEVERYKKHGLALVDINILPNWSRKPRYHVSYIGAADLREHSRPVKAWVKKTTQPDTFRVCIASEKLNAPEHATLFAPEKELETLDVMILQTPQRRWCYGPVELEPEYLS